MSEVKRYRYCSCSRPCDCIAFIDEAPKDHSDYVYKATDYERLAARCAELEAKVVRYEDMMKTDELVMVAATEML